MGMLRNCFCDPFKLTYVAAIITAIEGGVFAILNIVLICMTKCAIKPHGNRPAMDMEKFWAFYFYDEQACIDKYPNYTAPYWINQTFPIDNRRSQTTVEAHYAYQITYLALHSGWVLSALILIYGNARKLWGYYVPWLLITLTILIMDVVVSSYCIMDLVDVDAAGYTSAMFWILVMYFRLFLIYFMNMSEFGSGCNSFCKSYHKRSKQARRQQKTEQKHAAEISRAEAAAAAMVMADMQQEQQEQPQHYMAPQQQQQHYMAPRNQQHQQPYQQHPMQQQPPPNYGYGSTQPAYPAKHQPPPVPKKPKAPPELRPFNYLNPAFRPDDQHDLTGMRTHAALVPSPTLLPHKDLPQEPTEPQYPGNDEEEFFDTADVAIGKSSAPAIPLQRFNSSVGNQNDHQQTATPAPLYPDYDGGPQPPLTHLDRQGPLPRVNISSRGPTGSAKAPTDASHYPPQHSASPTVPHAHAPPQGQPLQSGPSRYQPPPAAHGQPRHPGPHHHHHQPPPPAQGQPVYPGPSQHQHQHQPPAPDQGRPAYPGSSHRQPPPSVPGQSTYPAMPQQDKHYPARPPPGGQEPPFHGAAQNPYPPPGNHRPQEMPPNNSEIAYF